MLRIWRRIALLAATPLCLSVAAPSSTVPRDPCTVLTRTEVQHLLLGKRVVRVKHRANAKNQAVECTWVTGFFQTTSLRRFNDAFSLQLTIQPVATATTALQDLRAKVRGLANETTGTIPSLGDEAYSNLGDAIVVSGDLVLQVGVSNYDSSVRPFPPVDDIARRAAVLVVRLLSRATPDVTGTHPT